MLPFAEEKRLLVEHWRYVLFCLPFIILVHNTAHNAVFFRWNLYKMYEKPSLPDILMANDKATIRWADHIRFGAMTMMWITLAGACLFRSKHSFVLIFRRFVVVYTVASLLRCATFFVTLLPGTADYCIAPSIGGTYSSARAPQNVWQIFTRFDWTHGCGDLLFSGHTALMVLVWLMVELCFENHTQRFNEAKSNWDRNFAFAQLLAVLGMRMKMTIFLLTTPISRKHYTIDVLVGLYVTVLLWKNSAYYFPTTIENLHLPLPLSSYSSPLAEKKSVKRKIIL